MIGTDMRLICMIGADLPAFGDFADQILVSADWIAIPQAKPALQIIFADRRRKRKGDNIIR